MTDHGEHITLLRGIDADGHNLPGLPTPTVVALVADLLEMHDATGISLDNWPAARTLVEFVIDAKIEENHA